MRTSPGANLARSTSPEPAGRERQAIRDSRGKAPLYNATVGGGPSVTDSATDAGYTADEYLLDAYLLRPTESENVDTLKAAIAARRHLLDDAGQRLEQLQARAVLVHESLRDAGGVSGRDSPAVRAASGGAPAIDETMEVRQRRRRRRRRRARDRDETATANPPNPVASGGGGGSSPDPPQRERDGALQDSRLALAAAVALEREMAELRREIADLKLARSTGHGGEVSESRSPASVPLELSPPPPPPPAPIALTSLSTKLRDIRVRSATAQASALRQLEILTDPFSSPLRRRSPPSFRHDGDGQVVPVSPLPPHGRGGSGPTLVTPRQLQLAEEEYTARRQAHDHRVAAFGVSLAETIGGGRR